MPVNVRQSVCVLYKENGSSYQPQSWYQSWYRRSPWQLQMVRSKWDQNFKGKVSHTVMLLVPASHCTSTRLHVSGYKVPYKCKLAVIYGLFTPPDATQLGHQVELPPRRSVERCQLAIKLEFHDADTDADILARILADTSDTRDFLKLFLWQAERHADILATIFARMSARMSVSVTCPCRRRGIPALTHNNMSVMKFRTVSV